MLATYVQVYAYRFVDAYAYVLSMLRPKHQRYLLETRPDDPFAARYASLTDALAGLVEDFGEYGPKTAPRLYLSVAVSGAVLCLVQR